MKHIVKGILPMSIFILFVIAPGMAAEFGLKCPESCACLSEANAINQYGKGNYQMCGKKSCGSETLIPEGLIKKYCFKPLCPQGCICMTDFMAKERRYSPCSNQIMSCGYDQNQNPMFCFAPTTQPQCPSGCQCLTKAESEKLGYSTFCQDQRIDCGKDDSGFPKYCYQSPPTDKKCQYDYGAGKCIGACPYGNCQLNTIYHDPKTGKVTYAECHCK